jgi:thiamine-monophosphate kinase
MISVTAFGRVANGKMIRRQGAAVGDRVVVTGSIGDAALGLAVLKGGAVAAALAGDAAARDMFVSRYRIPRPRGAFAEVVLGHATSAMDVSDGLAGDLAKLCAVSGVSATIDASAIPLSDPAKLLLKQGVIGLEAIVSGGDDYEILCTVPENHLQALALEAGRAGVPVSVIGTIIAGSSSPRFIDREGRDVPLKRLSYSHF